MNVGSIAAIGKADTAGYWSYVVDLESSDERHPAVEIDFRLASGSTVEQTWTGVTYMNTTKPPYFSDGTLDRRTPDITAASVDAVSDGGGKPMVSCTGERVNVGTDQRSSRAEVAIINDNIHHFTPTIVSESSLAEFTEAEFIRRTPPEYPSFAMQAGVEGTVSVEVDVGTDGLPKKLQVESSSQIDSLDAAAVKAAAMSTFKPAALNGTPIDRQYLIIYTFSDAGLPPSRPSCPLVLESIADTNSRQPTSADWYSLYFSATRNDIVGARVTFETNDGKQQEISWPSIAMPSGDAPDLDGQLGLEGATPIPVAASIAWTGPLVRRAWVDSVDLKGGQTQRCSRWHEWANRDDASQTHFRVPSALTSFEGSLFEASADQPLSWIYPPYPDGAKKSGVTGSVSLELVVDPSGTVSGAVMTESSGDADLDEASVSAALKLKFIALASGAERLERVRYDFMSQPDRPPAIGII